MSVATASARLRVRSTRTISRALPRLTAAIAQAQPTAPTPTIPILLMVASWGVWYAAWSDSGMRGHPSMTPDYAIAPSGLRARYKDCAPDIRTPLHPRLFHLAAFKGAANCLKRRNPAPHPDRTCPMNAPAQIVPPYRHTPLFPLGKDSTPYRKLTSEGVRMDKVLGRDVLVVAPEAMRLLAEAAFLDINHLLRPRHLHQLAALPPDAEASDNDQFDASDFIQKPQITLV